MYLVHELNLYLSDDPDYIGQVVFAYIHIQANNQSLESQVSRWVGIYYKYELVVLENGTKIQAGSLDESTL